MRTVPSHSRVKIIFYLFAIGISVAFASEYRERWMLLLAGSLSMVAIALMYIRPSWPISGQLDDDRTEGGVVLQTSSYSCGAASLANVIIMLGYESSEREMAWLAGTSKLGTSAGEIVRALGKKGVAARKTVLTLEQLREMDRPAILLVEYMGLGPMSHAVAFKKLENDRFIVLDPFSGEIDLTSNELAYKWDGYAVVLEEQ